MAPGPGGPLPPPARAPTPTFAEWFRTSPWWHKALVALPLVLVFFGGLLGALTAILLAAVNQAVLRTRLGPGPKLAICVVVIVAGITGYLLVVGLITALLGIGTSQA